jgi:hypothetical protein
MPNQLFRFKLSYYFLILLGLLSLATSIVIWQLPLAYLYRDLLLLLTLAVSTYIAYRYILYKHRYAMTALERLSNGCWRIHTRQGMFVMKKPLGNSIISPWLMILRFNITNQHRLLTAIIFKDSLLDDEFRKLLVLVRMG